MSIREECEGASLGAEVLRAADLVPSEAFQKFAGANRKEVTHRAGCFFIAGRQMSHMASATFPR
jgi:hypothetical protein